MARCCVETLQALRENSASVLTIVEVRYTSNGQNDDIASSVGH